jgi:hypothetical protein
MTFFFDVNTLLLAKGLHRMDDMLRPAAMSGMISDMLTASMATFHLTNQIRAVDRGDRPAL